MKLSTQTLFAIATLTAVVAVHSHPGKVHDDSYSHDKAPSVDHDPAQHDKSGRDEITVPEHIKHPEAEYFTNNTLTTRDEAHPGVYYCCLPRYGGMCKWMPLNPNKCERMDCGQGPNFGSSFGPDKGLICSIYEKKGCQGTRIQNWRYGRWEGQDTGVPWWAGHGMPQGVQSYECRMLEPADDPQKIEVVPVPEKEPERTNIGPAVFLGG